MTDKERDKKGLEIKKNGLLQFRALDDKGYLEKCLINNTISFGPPKNFNDPFDCRMPVILDNEFGEILDYLKFANLEQKIFMTEDDLRKLAIDFLDSPLLFENRINAEIFGKNRFTCFSICSKKNLFGNSRFWAEYAGKHHGICLKFSGDIFGSEHLFKNSNNVFPLLIDYCSEIPNFNYIQYKLQKKEDKREKEYVSSAQYFIGTKSKEYEHEKELRFVYNSLGPIHKDYLENEFNPIALKEVYLGCEQTPAETKKVVDWLSFEKYDHVDIYKLVPEKTKFRFIRIIERRGKKRLEN